MLRVCVSKHSEIRTRLSIQNGKDASADAEAMVIMMKHIKKIVVFALLILSFSLLTAAGAAICAEDSAESAVPLPDTAANDEPVQESEQNSAEGTKAIAAALAVGLVAAVGAVSMALSIAKSTESMARQPEAAGKINSAMMLGLVFIETAIIYALIVAILIIFVL